MRGGLALWSDRDRTTPWNKDSQLDTSAGWSAARSLRASAARVSDTRGEGIKRAERENSLGQLFSYTGSRFEVDMSGQGKAHIPSSSSRYGCRSAARPVSAVPPAAASAFEQRQQRQRRRWPPRIAEEDRRCCDGMFRHPRDVT